ncbi:MAG: electron transfer flavoprotein subunit beta/FixA family protein [Candidatus Firestonebacteria bacterium]
MNIVVCIKQVPGTTKVAINPITNTLIREGIESIVNPFDMYALEEGIRLKEKFGGKVTVMTMGPPQAKEALKMAMGMGADDAVLISDRAFAGSDTLATSYTLSKGIKKIGDFDIIICGKQAMDGDTAQVGPGISHWLNIPFVAWVRKIEEVKEEDKYIKVERLMEDGYEIIESPLPVLLSVVKEINEPRIESLKGKMKAKNYNIPVWSAKDLECDPDYIGLRGSPTIVNKIFVPVRSCKKEIIEGNFVEEKVDKLIAKLKDAKLVM